MKTIGYFALLTMMTGLASASGDLEPWPAAKAGETRWVFRVPELDNEQDYKVEILVGRELEVDCNRINIGGSLKRETIQGWGYPLYRIRKIRPGASTLIACPEGEPKTIRFVSIQGVGFLRRYNSKLPYVVYVPKDYEVRYRYWFAGDPEKAKRE